MLSPRISTAFSRWVPVTFPVRAFTPAGAWAYSSRVLASVPYIKSRLMSVRAFGRHCSDPVTPTRSRSAYQVEGLTACGAEIRFRPVALTRRSRSAAETFGPMLAAPTLILVQFQLRMPYSLTSLRV